MKNVFSLTATLVLMLFSSFPASALLISHMNIPPTIYAIVSDRVTSPGQIWVSTIGDGNIERDLYQLQLAVAPHFYPSPPFVDRIGLLLEYTQSIDPYAFENDSPGFWDKDLFSSISDEIKSTPTPVPEAASILLLGVGLLGLVEITRSYNRKRLK